jgi:hypothetical protein
MSPLSEYEKYVTSDKGQVEFDDIIGFFIEIELIWSNIGVSSGIIKILFHHLKEISAFRNGREPIRGQESVSYKFGCKI